MVDEKKKETALPGPYQPTRPSAAPLPEIYAAPEPTFLERIAQVAKNPMGGPAAAALSGVLPGGDRAIPAQADPFAPASVPLDTPMPPITPAKPWEPTTPIPYGGAADTLRQPGTQPETRKEMLPDELAKGVARSFGPLSGMPASTLASIYGGIENRINKGIDVGDRWNEMLAGNMKALSAPGADRFLDTEWAGGFSIGGHDFPYRKVSQSGGGVLLAALMQTAMQAYAAGDAESGAAMMEGAKILTEEMKAISGNMEATTKMGQARQKAMKQAREKALAQSAVQNKMEEDFEARGLSAPERVEEITKILDPEYGAQSQRLEQKRQLEAFEKQDPIGFQKYLDDANDKQLAKIREIMK